MIEYFGLYYDNVFLDLEGIKEIRFDLGVLYDYWYCILDFNEMGVIYYWNKEFKVWSFLL